MIKKNAKLWLLDGIPLFDILSPDQKIAMQNSATEQKYNNKEVVVHSGDKINFVHFIVKGRVKIVKISEAEKESIKRVLRSGDYFGAMAAVDPKSYPTFNDSAIVMERDTVILSIPLSIFAEIIKNNPVLYQKIIVGILSNYKKLNRRLDSIMLKNSKVRIVDFIKEMAEEIGKPIGHEVLIKHNLTHQQIASITGISRQKVTTILNEFKQEGLIHLERNSILVHDTSLLE